MFNHSQQDIYQHLINWDTFCSDVLTCQYKHVYFFRSVHRASGFSLSIRDSRRIGVIAVLQRKSFFGFVNFAEEMR